jgi:hypothetical protein
VTALLNTLFFSVYNKEEVSCATLLMNVFCVFTILPF